LLACLIHLTGEPGESVAKNSTVHSSGVKTQWTIMAARPILTDMHDTDPTTADRPELRPEFVAGPPERPAWPAIAKGLRHRCPACGEGALYQSYLKLAPACPDCGEDLSHARADDGPAYLSILVTAKVMGTLMLVVYETFQPSPYVLATTFSVGVVAMALYLLPRFKGLIVGVQWAKRMHGF
jgi:uncharacterized protein (DUF983 family)